MPYLILVRGNPEGIDPEDVDRIRRQVEERQRVPARLHVAPQDKKKVVDKVLKQLNTGEWSPKMVAIAGFILDQEWTEPYISEMAVMSDGFVMASRSDDVGMNDFMGQVSDLERNWEALLEAADLTAEERGTAELLFSLRIRDWRTP